MSDLLKDFYPTPKPLIRKMLSKIKRMDYGLSILEPSAGKGDIIDYINKEYRYGRSKIISAIEINPEHQATLRGKNIRLIDSDFLNYNGQEHFDLIVANFPFSEGVRHLNKAIDIIFNGEIVCLINAETLKNPYSNAREALLKRLESLDASIEYLDGTFESAQRKTSVEVALIYINKTESVETQLFQDMSHQDEEEITFEENRDLATNDDLHNLITEFEETRTNVINQLVAFYRNHHLTKSYLDISIKGAGTDDEDNLTQLMKANVNAFINQLKKDYWQKVTNLKDVRGKLTSKKRQEFVAEISKYETLDFTEANIKQFILNTMVLFPKMVHEAIEHLFDEFTFRSVQGNHWGDEYKKNIHLYNGWKTNSAYKVNKKVIQPIYWCAYSNKTIEIDYRHNDLLTDMDIVISYFTSKPIGTFTFDICKEQVKQGITKKIDTEYFLITFYKKGTMHLEFKDLDILRLFNIEGGKLKGYLPDGYGDKAYDSMTNKEQSNVDAFEGSKNYKHNPSSLAILAGFKRLLPTGITYANHN